jgi:hypothetical protein
MVLGLRNDVKMAFRLGLHTLKVSASKKKKTCTKRTRTIVQLVSHNWMDAAKTNAFLCCNVNYNQHKPPMPLPPLGRDSSLIHYSFPSSPSLPVLYFIDSLLYRHCLYYLKIRPYNLLFRIPHAVLGNNKIKTVVTKGMHTEYQLRRRNIHNVAIHNSFSKITHSNNMSSCGLN